MPRKKGMTFSEHSAILAADPAYQKMRKEKDDDLYTKKQLLQNDASPLFNELQAIGWSIQSVWDLVNTPSSYPDAIPILLKHLKKPYLDRKLEGIARALAVPSAAYAWSTLKEEYQAAATDSGAKSGLAVALSATVNESVIREMIELAKDPSHGRSRILLLRGLRKSRSPLAREALVELADDPTLAKEIASWKRTSRSG